MPSATSTSLRLELMASGEKANTWGTITNDNLGTLLEEAICGYIAVPVSNTVDTVLTHDNWVSDQARNAVIELTGTLTATRNVIAPNVPKVYIVKNSTTGGQSVVFKKAGGTGITIPNGKTTLLFYNKTTLNFEEVVPYSAETATTATNLTGDQTNYVTKGRVGSVANMLGWKNFGNGYVIFDASAGTSPTGSTVNNTNSTYAWTPTHSTLMGWNGTSTYGVRVDSARLADSATTATSATTSSSCSGNSATATSATLAHTLSGGNCYAAYLESASNMYVATTILANGRIESGTDFVAVNLAHSGANLPLYSTTGGRIVANSSDSRLKTEVITSLPGLQEVLQLKTHAFKWNEDIENRGEDASIDIGFFANETVDIIPSSAPMKKDGYYGFSERPIIAALVKAVQELSAKVTALEAK